MALVSLSVKFHSSQLYLMSLRLCGFATLSETCLELMLKPPYLPPSRPVHGTIRTVSRRRPPKTQLVGCGFLARPSSRRPGKAVSGCALRPPYILSVDKAPFVIRHSRRSAVRCYRVISCKQPMMSARIERCRGGGANKALGTTRWLGTWKWGKVGPACRAGVVQRSEVRSWMSRANRAESRERGGEMCDGPGTWYSILRPRYLLSAPCRLAPAA